jgi:hypothetical protein
MVRNVLKIQRGWLIKADDCHCKVKGTVEIKPITINTEVELLLLRYENSLNIKSPLKSYY